LLYAFFIFHYYDIIIDIYFRHYYDIALLLLSIITIILLFYIIFIIIDYSSLLLVTPFSFSRCFAIPPLHTHYAIAAIIVFSVIDIIAAIDIFITPPLLFWYFDAIIIIRFAFILLADW